jgi:hypothetical protein
VRGAMPQGRSGPQTLGWLPVGSFSDCGAGDYGSWLWTNSKEYNVIRQYSEYQSVVHSASRISYRNKVVFQTTFYPSPRNYVSRGLRSRVTCHVQLLHPPIHSPTHGNRPPPPGPRACSPSCQRGAHARGSRPFAQHCKSAWKLHEFVPNLLRKMIRCFYKLWCPPHCLDCERLVSEQFTRTILIILTRVIQH